jgi:hypothetical protein
VSVLNEGRDEDISGLLFFFFVGFFLVCVWILQELFALTG